MNAVPAKRGVWRTLQLADGTEVRVQLVGDEHGHYWLAADGTAYARQGGKFFKKVDAQQIAKRAKARRQQVNAKRLQRLKSRRASGVGSYTGTKRGIIILVNFQDLTFKSGNNKALYEKIANQANYKEGDFKGSMADYFKAQSRNQFELDFDVVGPVTVSHDYAYYGKNDSKDNDTLPGTMVCEAVKLAKDLVSDWKQYDWDGDGYVDQVYLIYAGKGEADAGVEDLPDAIWPHAYSLSGAKYYGDGEGRVTVGTRLYVDTYACGSELNGSGKICGIGTMCHEFSHCLGYPDFYDIDYSGGQGMGGYDLMDSGSYNDDGYQPAGYTSYERWVVGWEEPIALEGQDVAITNMKSLQNGGESYIIYNKGNQNEYFLLENRQFDGWDASLSYNGLLILHCDFDEQVWWSNQPNDDPDHQRMTVVPADGKYTYTIYEGVKYYDDAPLFPYESVNAFNRSFKIKRNDTVAERAAKFFTKNTDGTYWLDSSIENITQNSDGSISFNFVANYGGSAEDSGEGEYEKVTSTTQLVVGSQYVLINEAKNAGNGAYDQRKYLKAVDVDITGNMVSGDDLVSMTLGGNANGYSLKIDNKYLYADDAKSLKLGSTERKDWLIESTNDGYIVKSKTSSYGKIQYNSGTPRFLNYTSNQSPAVLYVQKAATAIQNISIKKRDSNRIYTLDGRYVGTDPNRLPRGLYILNGKKFVK